MLPAKTLSTLARHSSVAVLPICLCLVSGAAGRFALASGGQLELLIVDRDTRQPIPCRMHLRNAAGKPRRAKRMPFWHDHFALPGKVTLRLPAGSYSFEIERGPEYLVRSGHFTMNNFADDSQEIDLKRFVDMSAHGWWSGDLCVRRPVREIELLMQAEDLHVVPLVSWWNDKSSWAGKTPPEQLLLRFDTDRYCHLMGGEQTVPGGTLLYFNLPAPLQVDGLKAPKGGRAEYPSPMMYLEAVRKHRHAWVDLSTPFWWDLPMLVANGQVNSIQVAHSRMGRNKTVSSEAGGKPRDKQLFPGVWGNAQWSQAIYFHLLECGLRIPPSAGSGSGEGPNPPGYNRMYVHVEGQFDYQKWWENFRAGRVTITNGPLLRPEVHGQLPGHVFQAQQGQELEFEIGLTLSTRQPISYLRSATWSWSRTERSSIRSDLRSTPRAGGCPSCASGTVGGFWYAR